MKCLFICVVAYEQDHSYVLEVGVSVCRSRDIPVTTYHFIIEENEYLCNGRYVSDHRNWFMYGRSIRCSFKEAMQKVAEELKDAQYLVGHDLRGELEVLRKTLFKATSGTACLYCN